jgi:hypothetical protein
MATAKDLEKKQKPTELLQALLEGRQRLQKQREDFSLKLARINGSSPADAKQKGFLEGAIKRVNALLESTDESDSVYSAFNISEIAKKVDAGKWNLAMPGDEGASTTLVRAKYTDPTSRAEVVSNAKMEWALKTKQYVNYLKLQIREKKEEIKEEEERGKGQKNPELLKVLKSQLRDLQKEQKDFQSQHRKVQDAFEKEREQRVGRYWNWATGTFAVLGVITAILLLAFPPAGLGFATGALALTTIAAALSTAAFSLLPFLLKDLRFSRNRTWGQLAASVGPIVGAGFVLFVAMGAGAPLAIGAIVAAGAFLIGTLLFKMLSSYYGENGTKGDKRLLAITFAAIATVIGISLFGPGMLFASGVLAGAALTTVFAVGIPIIGILAILAIAFFFNSLGDEKGQHKSPEVKVTDPKKMEDLVEEDLGSDYDQDVALEAAQGLADKKAIVDVAKERLDLKKDELEEAQAELASLQNSLGRFQNNSELKKYKGEEAKLSEMLENVQLKTAALQVAEREYQHKQREYRVVVGEDDSSPLERSKSLKEAQALERKKNSLKAEVDSLNAQSGILASKLQALRATPKLKLLIARDQSLQEEVDGKEVTVQKLELAVDKLEREHKKVVRAHAKEERNPSSASSSTGSMFNSLPSSRRDSTTSSSTVLGNGPGSAEDDDSSADLELESKQEDSGARARTSWQHQNRANLPPNVDVGPQIGHGGRG